MCSGSEVDVTTGLGFACKVEATDFSLFWKRGPLSTQEIGRRPSSAEDGDFLLLRKPPPRTCGIRWVTCLSPA